MHNNSHKSKQQKSASVNPKVTSISKRCLLYEHKRKKIPHQRACASLPTNFLPPSLCHFSCTFNASLRDTVLRRTIPTVHRTGRCRACSSHFISQCDRSASTGIPTMPCEAVRSCSLQNECGRTSLRFASHRFSRRFPRRSH